jgi:small subunit ribosomal protein S9
MKQPKEKKTDVKKDLVYQAVGRRKESSARVKMVVTAGAEVKLGDKTLKAGDILVNKRPISEYFPGLVNEKIYMEPLRLTESIGRFAISALVVGGGLQGQRGAFMHAVSRALLKVDEEKFRPVLKKAGFLMRDPRAKQRRKAGYAQAARARKQSPKR